MPLYDGKDVAASNLQKHRNFLAKHRARMQAAIFRIPPVE